MIPPDLPSPKDDSQERNSMFQRLNKLANTKLLKPFISGKQLIDLGNNSEPNNEGKNPFKSKKMLKIFENKAQKAVENIRKKARDQNEDGDKLPKIQFTAKKLNSEVEVRARKPFLKSQGSLQVNFEQRSGRISHKKSSHAVLQKIDSFEIEGPAVIEEEKNEGMKDEKEENEVEMKIPHINDKKILTFQSMELEEMYDIRKSSVDPRMVSMLEEQQTDEPHEEEKVSDIAEEKKSNSRMLRKGFSYSDFEVGEENHKRKITFDRRFDSVNKKYICCKRMREKLRKWLDFSRMKLKFENSFVDVVITSEKKREIDVVLQKKKTIILPGSFVKRLNDLCLAILCLYVLFSTPVYIAFFTTDEYLNTLGIVCESLFCFLFFFDIWLTLRTGYVNRRGVLELYPTKIIFLYLKTNFFWDLISTLPIITLFPENPYLRLIYLLRLLKVLRFYKIISRLLEFSTVHPGIVRIIKCFIFWIILCHNFGCFYWYISTLSGFTSDGWVPPLEINEVHPVHQYLFSFFFSITVTSGVGINISPVSIAEILYSFFSIVIGVFMYGLLLGSATSALMGMDEEDSEIRKQMDSLNTFMRKKKVALELQKRIQENLKYLWSSNQSLNISNQWFLKGVHPLLKLELMLQINKRYLEKVPLFKNLNFEGMINLISLLETRIYLPDEFVVYENQIAEEMYFIQSGMLEVFDAKRSLKIRLFEGDFFGEQAIINRNSKRKASVKSIVYSELLILSRRGLEAIVLENQPFGKRLFIYLKKKILNKFQHMGGSKWDLLYMIKKAAINIKRMNPDISLESLFLPNSRRFNPKTPIVRTLIKDLEKIEETEVSDNFDYDEGEEQEKRPKTEKHRQFQENIYKTTSQLSELVRNVMKDKKDNRHKSAQPDEMNEVIEDMEKRKHESVIYTENDPYENYEYMGEVLEKKSRFGKEKTLDDRGGSTPAKKSDG